MGILTTTPFAHLFLDMKGKGCETPKKKGAMEVALAPWGDPGWRGGAWLFFFLQTISVLLLEKQRPDL